MRDESKGFALFLLFVLGIVAGLVWVIAYQADQEREACEELHRLYGSGRCVFARYDAPKIILPDGTPRYLPAQAERQR